MAACTAAMKLDSSLVHLMIQPPRPSETCFRMLQEEEEEED